MLDVVCVRLAGKILLSVAMLFMARTHLFDYEFVCTDLIRLYERKRREMTDFGHGAFLMKHVPRE